jgi:hypothetical protein
MSEELILRIAEPLKIVSTAHWSPDAPFFAVIISGVISLGGVILSIYSIRNQRIAADTAHKEREYSEFKSSLRAKVSELVGIFGLIYSQMKSISADELTRLTSELIECEFYIATLSRGANSRLEALVQATAGLRSDLSNLYNQSVRSGVTDGDFSFPERKAEILKIVGSSIDEERLLIFGQ